MYCINCGAKNKNNSKFCISCGKELEIEETSGTKERSTDIVETIKNKRSEFLEHKYDAKDGDTTGVRINGKELKVESKKETGVKINGETVKIDESPKKSNVGLIVGIIVGVVVFLGVSVFATYYIYTQFMASNKITTTAPKTPTTPSNKNDWYIDYTLPEGVEEKSYSSNTLRMYRYQKDGILCSLTVWKIGYISPEKTSEDLLKQYGSISKDSSIPVDDVKINGVKWKHREEIGHWSKYEFGTFDKSHENYYIIKYQDYDTDKPVCKEKLNQFIKSISYNK